MYTHYFYIEMIAVESVSHPDRQMSNKLDAFKKKKNKKKK